MVRGPAAIGDLPDRMYAQNSLSWSPSLEVERSQYDAEGMPRRGRGTSSESRRVRIQSLDQPSLVDAEGKEDDDHA
jgi:hypothetical protein